MRLQDIKTGQIVKVEYDDKFEISYCIVLGVNLDYDYVSICLYNLADITVLSCLDTSDKRVKQFFSYLAEQALSRPFVFDYFSGELATNMEPIPMKPKKELVTTFLTKSKLTCMDKLDRDILNNIKDVDILRSLNWK